MIKINKEGPVGSRIRTIHFWGVYVKERVKLYLMYFLNIILKRDNDNRLFEYPQTIQLPITYKCNFDCVMCGMRNLIQKEDFSYKDLKKILEDRLFKKVVAVSVNGGEPFLKKDIIECIDVMLTALPKLKNINFISNGYFTDKILDCLEKIYAMCKEKGVHLNVAFSVDGVGEMQDFMRGKKNAWINVNNTLDRIKSDTKKYCDDYNVVCTITKYNIYNIEEVELWAKKYKVNVAYNIATVNARIDNYEKFDDFTILNDQEARFLAQEFFYKKAMEEQSKRYYAIFLYIKEGKRYALCPCRRNSWVTLTPNGNISYCATYSNELGNALEKSAYDIFNGNIEYLNELKKEKCKGCSHYAYTLNKEGLKLFYRDLLNNQRILF